MSKSHRRKKNRKKRYPSDLSKGAWQVVKVLLPPAKSGGRPREIGFKKILNAIFYILKTGCQWAALPADFPHHKTVYHYFWTWRKAGIISQIHDTLRARLRQKYGRHKHATAGSLDRQSVKATAISCPDRGYDGGKKINGRKRHILVDTIGLIMAVTVTSAALQDRDGAKILLQHLGGSCKKLRLIWVDGGYRGALLSWVSERFKFVLSVVMRTDSQKGFKLLPRRWVVERTFGWLNHNRRLSKDYEVLPETAEAMIQLAMIHIMARRLVS